MKIFKDIITGDELLSDSFEPKEVDGIVYEADCAMININKDVDIDIGANPSAEEAEEAANTEGAEMVNNIVHNFNLNSTTFDKKAYLAHLKGYMKAVKAQLQAKGKSEEEVTAFEKGAAAYAKNIVANFKDYEFFVGESFNPDGMTVLLNYREDGTTPYVILWKHGLLEEKV